MAKVKSKASASTTGTVHVTIGVTPPGPKNYTSMRVDVGADGPITRSIEFTIAGVMKQLIVALEKETPEVFDRMDEVIRNVEKARR